MRKREIIMKEKEILQRQISDMTKDAAESDNFYKENIANSKKMIKLLDTESCYENTLNGQIGAAEADAIIKINTLLNKLTAVTGIKYLNFETLDLLYME